MAEAGDAWKNAQTMYEFKANDIDGNEVSLDKYKDHVCLIVNVASKWGFTDKNYTQLQELHTQYAESKGLRILAFPCNQFGGQEPGTDAEVKEFATGKYNAQFDLFSKINVNGDNAHPLWKWLKTKQTGLLVNAIKWNFSKFIVDKEGKAVARFAPNVEPNSIVKDLEKYW